MIPMTTYRVETELSPYALQLLAIGYAQGRAHQFTNPDVVPLASVSALADAVAAEGVDVTGFQALYERMTRGEATNTVREAA